MLLAGLVGIVLLPHSYARSDKERAGIWQAAVSTFAESPVFGVGADGFGPAFKKHKPADFSANSGDQVAEDAHNDILQVAATTGIVGLVAYAAVNYFAFAQTFGPALGCIVALFVCAKFNPIPLEGLVLGFVAIGLCAKDRIALPNIGRLAFCAVAVMVCGLVYRISAADRWAKNGDLASLLQADRLNPYELTYKARTVNAAVGALNESKDTGLRVAIIQEIRDQAASAISRRPLDSMAWQIAGAEASIETQFGIPRRASAYLDRAKLMEAM